MGVWCALPATGANRRGAMSLLRGLHRRDGWPLVPYEPLAHALGYADRRNVPNCWAEFEACGRDRAAFFQRRQKGDAAVVARCEQIGKAPPFWTWAPVLAECRRRWPAAGLQLPEQNMRPAGHQVGVLGVQQMRRRPWAEGDAQSQEPVVLEALCDLATASAQAQAAEALPGFCRPAQLAWVSPSGAAQEPRVTPAAAAGAVLEDARLPGEGSPSKLAQRGEGAAGAGLLAFLLYDHGWSLEGSGRCFGVPNTTGMRWLSPLAQVNWQGAVQQGARCFSGPGAVADKWSTIAGVWWSLWVAVEHGSGLPLHLALLPSNATPSCALFLWPLKARGYGPTVLSTEGWDASGTALARGFPHAQPLWGRFHALRAAFRRLRGHVPHGPARRVWADKLTALCRTPSTRTGQRRMHTLQAEAQDRPAQAVVPRRLAQLPQRLPAVGSTWRPTTSNAAERFGGAFERF